MKIKNRFGLSDNVRDFIKNRRLSQKMLIKDISLGLGYSGRCTYSHIETRPRQIPQLNRFVSLLKLLNLELLMQDKKGRFCEMPLSVFLSKDSDAIAVISLPVLIKMVEQTHDIYLCFKENPNKFCKLEIIDRKEAKK